MMHLKGGKAQQAGFDLTYLTAWPANDALRSDARYKRLLERIGVPPSGRRSELTPRERVVV